MLQLLSNSDNIIRLGLSDLDGRLDVRLEPKVASFNFRGPAKQGAKVKFSSKCDIFSSSMLMWKIAFDVIPYRNYTNIIDRIKAESLLQENEQIWTKNRAVDNITIDGDNDDPIPEAMVILPMIQPILLLEEDTDAFLQYLMLQHNLF
ncbi:hypothetical protein RhiirA4_470549 [Rhizophagus irregularis]|uniref:Uncharacterized protein n=1 Tax=Rhizophagus irregularis TaxID=588596 RepID=A0A2I1H1M4_9GLOM|nr:hypothetical protein RhiirA4_470549 [Rhizophagus irregularis]